MMLDVYGKRMLVERDEDTWRAYAVGPDGKRCPVNIVIPGRMSESEVVQYLDDIYHEAATPRRPSVIRLS